MKALDALLTTGLGTVYTAAAAEVRLRGAVIYQRVLGSLDPAGRLEGAYPGLRRATRFDFASLTKLYTTLAFFRLVDAGHVTLDTPVSAVLPAFSGPRPIRPGEQPLSAGEPADALIDASAVTFRHLLTHSSGLPAWIDLREAESVPARLALCLNAPFAYPPGTQVVYSDVGYILLGLAVEKLADAPLRAAMKRLVQKPLDLTIDYGPLNDGSVPPTEFCAWRGRRLCGEVHDENAAALGGAAGHAGLFGTVTDLALVGQIYLAEGGGFIGPRLAREATRPHVEDRGLGWMMRTPRGSSSGARFGTGSYGHTGFVGNSLWVDPTRQLVAALLTNAVFFGRDHPALSAFRPRFHDTLIEALEG